MKKESTIRFYPSALSGDPYNKNTDASPERLPFFG